MIIGMNMNVPASFKESNIRGNYMERANLKISLKDIQNSPIKTESLG